MLKVVERYLLRELVASFGTVLMVLMLIQLAFTIRRYLGDAAAGKLPASALFTLVGLLSLKYVAIIVPLALFIALLVTLGRWYRDSEMAALVACGGGPNVLLRPVGFFSFALMIMLLVLSFEAGPKVMRMAEQVEFDARQEAAVGLIEPGRFRSVPDGSGVFYVGGHGENDSAFKDLFVHLKLDKQRFSVITAEQGRLVNGEDGARLLELEQGQRYEGKAGEKDFRVVEFDKHRLSLIPPMSKRRDDDPMSKNTLELLQDSSNGAVAELHWRLAMPLTLIGFALLAIPLAEVPPRSGRLGRILPGMLIFVFYYNLLGVGRSWLEDGRIPAILGLWWVHGIFGFITLLYYINYLGLQPFGRRKRKAVASA